MVAGTSAHLRFVAVDTACSAVVADIHTAVVVDPPSDSRTEPDLLDWPSLMDVGDDGAARDIGREERGEEGQGGGDDQNMNEILLSNGKVENQMKHESDRGR